MSKITIYQKPTCSTCREALRLLKESGRPYEAVNYYETPFTKTQLRALLRKGGLKPADVLRTKEERYKSLGLAKKSVPDEELLDLMVQYPDLIQRPLVEAEDRVMLARPAETIKTLLASRPPGG